MGRSCLDAWPDRRLLAGRVSRTVSVVVLSISYLPACAQRERTRAGDDSTYPPSPAPQATEAAPAGAPPAPAGSPPARASDPLDAETRAAIVPRPVNGNNTPLFELPPELSHIVLSGGSGRDCEHPLKIQRARNTGEGMMVEKLWLRATYPGARPHEHALSHRGEVKLDAYALKLDGGIVHACFDVTEFFGEW
jgi:hypothetical protein